MFKRRYCFFCDKLSYWRAFGASYNWDDGYYFGIYIYKYFIGIHKLCNRRNHHHGIVRKNWNFYKEAIVKTEDLKKDL